MDNPAAFEETLRQRPDLGYRELSQTIVQVRKID